MMIYLGLLLVVMFLRCCNTCQRDRVGQEIEKALPFLASRKLLSIITLLKTLPLVVIGIMLFMLSRTTFFVKSKLVLYFLICQILITTAFNIFNIYRFERPNDTQSYWRLNARFT